MRSEALKGAPNATRSCASACRTAPARSRASTATAPLASSPPPCSTGDWKGFLKESLAGQDGRILIHTKLLMTDFTSDQPTVVSKSHNLSRSARRRATTRTFWVIGGATDVADCYGVELMRQYDHYRLRFSTKSDAKKPPPQLTSDDSWTDRYFD